MAKGQKFVVSVLLQKNLPEGKIVLSLHSAIVEGVEAEHALGRLINHLSSKKPEWNTTGVHSMVEIT